MKPKYIAIAAVTIDGKIARHSKHPTNWTSKEDKDFLHAMLNRCDLVIVGRKTFELAKKPLSKRNCLVFTKGVKKLKIVNTKLAYFNPRSSNLQKLIAQKNYKRIAVLGGKTVYNYFLNNDLLDEIYLTIEPIVFGSGLPVFDTNTKNVNYKLKSVKKLNNKGSLLLYYKKIT